MQEVLDGWPLPIMSRVSVFKLQCRLSFSMQVANRYNQLKDQGTLSAKRLPRIMQPLRPCTHWDYMLMEMAWMARDYTVRCYGSHVAACMPMS